MVYIIGFFCSKCSLFHNSNLFGSCIIHILYTGYAEIKKNNNSGTKRLNIALAKVVVVTDKSNIFFSFLCLQVQYKGTPFSVSVHIISFMKVNYGFGKKKTWGF